MSAKKKAGWENRQITPLHCACINPSTGPLEALFKVCPDIHVSDRDERKLVHYAAACTDVAPLEFLISKGVNLEDSDKSGLTPLMIAAKVGRASTADFIIEKLSEINVDEYHLKSIGKGVIDKPGKDTWCPIHIAVAGENHEVVKVLIKHGCDLDKALSTRYDRITPLMIAAANGDLEMVKILIDGKAKIEYRDRYKRTALTHAVINGSSHIASYLLSLGADPNMFDSSKNSNLHYACAYGWWFCMRVLIDAGAKIDALNEWSLTPLGVAILKGNKGIVDHLITLPGIDINTKDDKGRTILIQMLEEKKAFSEEILKDIKRLVKEYGADPKLTDNYGKSALHYIASFDYSHDKDELAKELKTIKSIVAFLLQEGVSSLKADAENNIPLVYALRNQYPSTGYENYGRYCDKSYKTGNTQLMKDLLSNMNRNWNKLDKETVKDCMKNLLQEFVQRISLIKISEYQDIFQEINIWVNSLKENQAITNTNFIDEQNSDTNKSVTVFAQLCDTYAQQNFQTSYDEENTTKELQNLCWNVYANILEQFIVKFEPEFEIQFMIKQGGKEIERRFSAMLSFSKVKQDSYKGFKVVLKYAKNVDVCDANNVTPLQIMIENQQVDHAKTLIQSGADVNRIRRFKDIKADKDTLELPIEKALTSANNEMMGLLLASRATPDTFPITGQSLFHDAVEKCGKEKTKKNLDIVRLLLDNGCDVNEGISNGKTPLHTATSISRDDTDASLDLEILLIMRGANLNTLDDELRTPLHYAFLKQGKSYDTTPSDPIQKVSILVKRMCHDMIPQKDRYGCSALHYAALRGSTVCALLLIKHGCKIDEEDNRGNTALSNAVHGKHDSCTLMLLQKNASINIMINHNKTEKEIKLEINKLWKYLPDHFPVKKEETAISLFEGIVTNDWLGITYIVLETMEKFGTSFARAIQVAFHIQKLQFAKTLISNQTSSCNLNEVINAGRNLMVCLAFETIMKEEENQEELISDLFQLLIDSKVDLTLVDHFGCSSLHYAALRKNHTLMKLLLSDLRMKSLVNKIDKKGRTPLASFFWNYSRMREKSTVSEKTLELLIQNGADLNTVFPIKPLSILDIGYDRHSETWKFNEELETSATIGVSPLIIAIAHKDYRMVNYLLENGANVWTADTAGKTPIMYAVKTNDQQIIDELLKHQSCMIKNETDNMSHSVIAHSIALDPSAAEMSTFDNAETLGKILDSVVDIPSMSSLNIEQPLLIAKQAAANDCLKLLSRATNKKFKETFNFPGALPASELNRKFDHKVDSKKMMKKKEEELKKDKTYIDTDTKTQEGCIVKDGLIYKDYDILLHKVDVGFRSWGLYNFYRIQIWKENHKELYVLFTNWGRIDRWSNGQYQNTPYSTPEEAIAEFCKIFRSKSGNEWGDRKHFVNMKKKYRIVQVDFAKRMVKPTFDIDLHSKQKSLLPSSTQCMLKDITDVSMLKRAYDDNCKIDSTAVPFERIKEEAITQAFKVLEKLGTLISKKEKLNTQFQNSKFKVDVEKQTSAL